MARFCRAVCKLGRNRLSKGSGSSIFRAPSEGIASPNSLIDLANKSEVSLISSNNLKFTKRKKFYIGDVAISYETINSRSKKNNFLLEFDKAWVHGLLHLIGYNHVKNKDYFKMNKIEKKILDSAVRKLKVQVAKSGKITGRQIASISIFLL